jgi:hypothetical protein
VQYKPTIVVALQYLTCPLVLQSIIRLGIDLLSQIGPSRLGDEENCLLIRRGGRELVRPLRRTRLLYAEETAGTYYLPILQNTPAQKYFAYFLTDYFNHIISSPELAYS